MQNRLHYFLVRLLLVGVSFIGIILVSFLFTNLVPGGPVEQYLASLQAEGGEAVGGRTDLASGAMSEEQIEAVRRAFGLDLPLHQRFYRWLVTDRMGMRAYSFKFTNRTSWELISSRFPVSLSFGIPSLILTYLICIPLGIAKALRNGKPFDLVSSFVVFTLYAIPTFAFGMVLRMLFSGTVEGFWDIFPLSGHRSPPEIWATLSWWERVKDQAWHMFLPVLCYVIGNFAVLTLLMKNSLLEQINQDYVRTVLAKGGRMRLAVWRHAVRNALIPLATGIGGLLSVMFAGSVIIEQIFDIQGLGTLSFDALVGRDYVLFLAIVSIQSIIGLLGLVLSDFCYVLIDPRIHFGGDR
jgi:microcin C transport system permease protein